MTITCECGHEDDFDAFTATPITGPLQPGEYQCPQCRHHFTTRLTAPPRVLPSGFIMPAPRRVESLDPVL